MTMNVKTMTQHTPTYKEVCRDCRFFTSPEKDRLTNDLVSYCCPYACRIVNYNGKKCGVTYGGESACRSFEYSGQQWIIF